MQIKCMPGEREARMNESPKYYWILLAVKEQSQKRLLPVKQSLSRKLWVKYVLLKEHVKCLSVR